jgi:hypothetical protein
LRSSILVHAAYPRSSITSANCSKFWKVSALVYLLYL